MHPPPLYQRQTPLPCKVSVGGCCPSKPGAPQCFLHGLLLWSVEGKVVFASSALGPPPLRTLIPQIRVWWRRLQALCSSLPYKYTCCFSDGATEDLLCCCDSIRIHAIPALNFPDVRGGSSTLSVILLISHFHISDILIVSMTILGKVRGDETSGLILLSYSDLSRFVHPLIHLVNCHRAKSAINLDRVSSSCYFLLIQLARAHPPFPTLGNYPHSSRHVFMFLKIIRCSSLRSLT